MESSILLPLIRCVSSPEVVAVTLYDAFVQILTEGRLKEVPEWFPGARLNYAENVLRHNTDAIACTSARETGQIAHYSFRQLRNMVQELAAALRVNGLQVGDRVAGECLYIT